MPQDSTDQPLEEAFDQTIDALNESKAVYALIGGFAVAVHGLPRPTRDVDILFSIPRIALPGLLDRLTERGFEFKLEDVLRELGQGHLSTISYAGVRIDLLDAALLPVFHRIVTRAGEHELRGRRVRVVTAEDLIALKMISCRETDIRDVRGILAAQQGSLKLDVVRKSLRECCDDERIQQFEQLVAQSSV